MMKGLKRLIPCLIEVVPGATAPEPPEQRLTRFGQTLLASGIGLLGLCIYLVAFATGASIAERLQFCPVLDQKSNQTESIESLSVLTRGDATNMLIWNYRTNYELIRELQLASKAQRLVLNQQIASLTIRLSRQCQLARFYRIQAGALSSVSTWAAVIVVVTGLIRLPRGIKGISRCEQAIFISSMSLLVLSIGYLTLGSPQDQAKTNWAYHRKGIQLFSQIRSSLANNQLLVTQEPDPTTPSNNPAIPLTNAAAVAELVSRVDNRLLNIDHGALSLNNSFAKQTFNNLFQEQQSPVNPLLSNP